MAATQVLNIPEGGEATTATDENVTVFRSITIPISLRTVAPFLDEAQTYAG